MVKSSNGLFNFVNKDNQIFHPNQWFNQAYDFKNEPIVGATVLVKGTTTAAITDSNGGYTINATQGSTLQVSFVGYVTVSKSVANQSTIDFTLNEDTQALADVVVVGFGKQKKESVTGAITTINAKDLRVPSSSLSTAFAGKLAGVVSVQRTGEPGADGADFWIRGISTFSSATSPLIYIDGVEAAVSDMNALPPESIENFSVLKDATATALYGARGANGVILINTRQGQRNERAKINIRVEGQMTQPTQMVGFADGVTFMEGYNEATTTRGQDPFFTQQKIDGTKKNLNPYIYPNVNWYDFLFNKWAYINEKNNSICVQLFVNNRHKL